MTLTTTAQLEAVPATDVAIRLPGEDWTFGHLRSRIEDAATSLAAGGVGTGSRVIVCGDDPISVMVSSLALAKLGAIWVPINPALRQEDLDYVLSHSDPAAVIANEAYAESIDVDGAGVWVADGAELRSRRNCSSRSAPRPPRPDDPASIMYTSGSSSRPKGVILSHAAHASMGADLVQVLGADQRDSFLLTAPLFHVGGWSTAVVPTIAAGCSIVIPGRFSASRFWEDVDRWRPTLWTTGLAFIEMVAARGGEPPSQVPFRQVLCNLRPDTWQMGREYLHLPLGSYYGLTENNGRGAIALDVVDYEPGFVGYPYTAADRFRITRDGEELPVGELGEIEMRGPSVMDGYFRNPEATAEALRPGGWLGTGDLGMLDERGRLFFRGRVKNIIRRSGENISAEEVELVLLQHPDLIDAIVLAVPDRVREEEVKAIVVSEPGRKVDAEQLHSFCEERIAGFKVPRYIEFTEQLPRTFSGKPDIATVRRTMSGVEGCWDREKRPATEGQT